MSLLSRLALLICCILPVAAVAANYEEGVHYTELAFAQEVETGNRVEVREFFWYGCPHCDSLEPIIDKWLKQKPKQAEFVRTPGTAPRWLPHAQMFYAAEALGALPKLHPAFFKAMHQQNRPLADEASILKFVAEQGVDAAKFKEAMGSFGVRLKVEKAKQANEAYGINSVPTIVVDGKYITSPKMARGEAEVMKVVDFLVQRAAKERKKR